MSLPEGERGERAYIGLGRRGVGRPTEPASQTGRVPASIELLMSDSARALAVSGKAEDATDETKARRAQRIADLVGGRAPADIWTDIVDMFVECFGEALDEVMDGKLPAEALAKLRDFILEFDKTLAIGSVAMQRLVRKNLMASRVAEETRAQTNGAATS